MVDGSRLQVARFRKEERRRGGNLSLVLKLKVRYYSFNFVKNE